MPLNIPAGMGLASFRLGFQNDDEPMYCTLGLKTEVNPLDESHARRCAAAWDSHIRPRLASSVQLREVTIRVRQTDGTDSLVSHAIAAPANGGVASDSFPPNVAFLVEKKTARGGKRGQGRMFIPGVSELDAPSNGVLDGATVTAWNTALGAFFTALDAVAGGDPIQRPCQPVIFHNNASTTTKTPTATGYTLTHTIGAAGPAPTVITSFAIDAKVATQRRRLR